MNDLNKSQQVSVWFFFPLMAFHLILYASRQFIQIASQAAARFIFQGNSLKKLSSQTTPLLVFLHGIFSGLVCSASVYFYCSTYKLFLKSQTQTEPKLTSFSNFINDKLSCQSSHDSKPKKITISSYALTRTIVPSA